MLAAGLVPKHRHGFLCISLQLHSRDPSTRSFNTLQSGLQQRKLESLAAAPNSTTRLRIAMTRLLQGTAAQGSPVPTRFHFEVLGHYSIIAQLPEPAMSTKFTASVVSGMRTLSNRPRAEPFQVCRRSWSRATTGKGGLVQCSWLSPLLVPGARSTSLRSAIRQEDRSGSTQPFSRLFLAS